MDTSAFTEQTVVVDADEMARLTGISADTFRYHAGQGYIPVIRRGQRYLFDVSRKEEMVAEIQKRKRPRTETLNWFDELDELERRVDRLEKGLMRLCRTCGFPDNVVQEQ